MATMTPTTGAVFIPEIWAKDVQMARRHKLVALNLVDHQYESDVSYGDTVHITSIAEMSADEITPGTALVPVAPTETEQTLVIDQYFGKAVEIQDMLKRQSKYDLRKPYSDVIGFALAKQIDTSLLSEYANAGASDQTKGTAGANTLTFDRIVGATTTLDGADVPMDERALIVNAVSLGDLRKLPEFTSYDSTGRTGVREKSMGIVGQIYGADVYLSNNVVDDGTAYENLLLHKSAIAVAVQEKPSVESDRDILKKADLLSGACLWGVKTVRADHMVALPRNKTAV